MLETSDSYSHNGNSFAFIHFKLINSKIIHPPTQHNSFFFWSNKQYWCNKQMPNLLTWYQGEDCDHRTIRRHSHLLQGPAPSGLARGVQHPGYCLHNPKVVLHHQMEETSSSWNVSCLSFHVASWSTWYYVKMVRTMLLSHSQNKNLNIFGYNSIPPSGASDKRSLLTKGSISYGNKIVLEILLLYSISCLAKFFQHHNFIYKKVHLVSYKSRTLLWVSDTNKDTLFYHCE